MQQSKMRLLPSLHSIGAGLTEFPTPANPGRVYLYIQNQGTNAVGVVFGGKADARAATMQIGGGSDYTWDIAVPIEAISLYSALGTTVYILEGNPP
jgi:hypothetical protein